MEEKVLNRVRKLLALASNNSSEHEAESALMMAQRLMAENDISIGQVDVDADNRKVTEVAASRSNRNMPWWHRELAGVIAKNFKVKYYTGVHYSRNKKPVPNSIVFVGFVSDVELAVEVYAYAQRTGKHLADRYARRQYSRGHAMHGLRDSFTEGFLNGLEKLFEEQVAENNWLAVIDLHPTVIDYVDELGLGSSHLGGNVNIPKNAAARSEAFSAGEKEGKEFDFNRKQITE